MIAPSVMMIEMGAALLKTMPAVTAEAQRRELGSFGKLRAQRIGATGLTDDFRVGYELGLATARAMLQGSAILALAKVKADEVL